MDFLVRRPFGAFGDELEQLFPDLLVEGEEFFDADAGGSA